MDAKSVSFLLVPVIVHKKLLWITNCSSHALYSEEVLVGFGSDIHQDILWCNCWNAPKKEQQSWVSSWPIMASFYTVSAQCSAPRSQGLISYLSLCWWGDQRGEMAVGVPLCAPWKDKDFMLFPIWYLFLAQPPHSSPGLPAASTPTRLALSAFLWGARLSTYLTV